ALWGNNSHRTFSWRGAAMTSEDRANPGILDILDTALLGAIRGAVWLPLVAIPRLIQRTLPSVVKLFRVLLLAAVWVFLVFGPLVFLAEVRDLLPGLLIVGWTATACVGSIAGIFRRSRRRAAVRRLQEKPSDLREAFA